MLAEDGGQTEKIPAPMSLGGVQIRSLEKENRLGAGLHSLASESYGANHFQCVQSL
jgi:hypothetical protein